MTTVTTQNPEFENAPSSLVAYLFYAGGVLLAGTCAAILIGACAARAQTVSSTEPAMSTSPMSAAVASDAAEAPVAISSAPPSPAKAAPRYSAKDIERAFGFIDANKDSKISREEASGFRNVAKYFDAADTNKDGALSLEEFGSALNRP